MVAVLVRGRSRRESARNLFYDKGSAELGEYVLEGGFGLVRVPVLILAASGEVLGVVAAQCVPDGDANVDVELAWHGAFDRVLEAVTGLADAQRPGVAWPPRSRSRPVSGVFGVWRRSQRCCRCR